MELIAEYSAAKSARRAARHECQRSFLDTNWTSHFVWTEEISHSLS